MEGGKEDEVYFLYIYIYICIYIYRNGKFATRGGGVRGKIRYWEEEIREKIATLGSFAASLKKYIY